MWALAAPWIAPGTWVFTPERARLSTAERRPDFVQLNGGYAPNGRFAIHYPELALLFRAMQKEGTYDLANPVFFQDGQIIVKRKDAGWVP